jgi:hypothetical protein
MILAAGCAQRGATVPEGTATQAVPAATTGAATEVPTAIPATPTEVPAATTAAPTDTATAVPDPTAACPQPSGDTALYVNREHGYCLLYPSAFTAEVDTTRSGGILQLTGPQEEPGPKQQEVATVLLFISLNGPPEGMDSIQYTARWFELYAPGMELDGQDASIGGQPATIAEDLPGFTRQRGAFIVAPHGRYTIFLTPQPGEIPELSEAASLAWETVTGSIVFFEPDAESAYVRAEDVCPEATAEASLLTDYTTGYCFLYPAGFEPDPDIPGRIIGGPVLGSEQGFEDISTSLAIGTFGMLDGQTLMEVLEPRMETIVPDSIEETTIAGHHALTFRGPTEPWTHRQAFVDVDGIIYTIVAQPDEPEHFSAGAPYLEEVWDLALETLAFFTPWR